MQIPADIPKKQQARYRKNLKKITNSKGRLMLFAGDQKIEHLNDDFLGKGIHKDDQDPEHLFRIASKGKIGAFAAQLGLISLYGKSYPKVPYIVKLNSKTPLVSTKQMDPYSEQLIDIEQVEEFRRNSNLDIVGVGFTIYIGSEFESAQLRNAAQITYEAHQHGLVVIFWIYPRGKAVKDEKDPHVIAGATGVAACLGADFVKVNYPKRTAQASFIDAVKAAGRTKVICAGGGSKSPKEFLAELHTQIQEGACGNATGRNIHQKSLADAVKLCNAIAAINDGKTVEQAMKLIK